MKKISLIPFLIIPTVFGLFSCGEDNSLTELKYGQMETNNVTEVTYQEISEMMKDDAGAYLVTVYAKNCSCWSKFKTILQNYIVNYHVKVYAITYDNFTGPRGENRDTFGMNVKSGATSFHIIDKGKLKYNQVGTNVKAFEEYASFEKMMSELVILPHMFYISLEQVDSLFKSEETSLIYFARSNCSDCQSFDRNVLEKYEFNNNLYILDCESIGIREYDDEGNLTAESATKWQEFKDNYYLSNKNNLTYGYDVGYVPSLFLFKGNEEGKPTILSGLVYQNDEVSKDASGYYVSNSYFTSERKASLTYLNNLDIETTLLNKRLTDDEVIDYSGYYYWKNANIYHDKYAKAFLDENLKKVTSVTVNIE